MAVAVGCDTSTGIEPNPLYAPAGLVSPGPFYDAGPVEVFWQPVENVSAYEIEYVLTRYGRSITTRDTVNDSRFVLEANVGIYDWRVRAFRESLISEWSETQRFNRNLVSATFQIQWEVDGDTLDPNTRYFLEPEALASVGDRLNELELTSAESSKPVLEGAELEISEPEGQLVNQFSDYRAYIPGTGGSALMGLPEPPPVPSASLNVYNSLLPSSIFYSGIDLRLQIQTREASPLPVRHTFSASGEVVFELAL